MSHAFSLVQRITTGWVNNAEKGPRKEIWFSWREDGNLYLNDASSSRHGSTLAAVKNSKKSPTILINWDPSKSGWPVYSSRISTMAAVIDREADKNGYEVSYLSFSILEKASMDPLALNLLESKNGLHLVGQNKRKMITGGGFGSLVSLRCTDVEQALDFLKPEIVKQAEKDQREIIRQGDWFFVGFPEHQETLAALWSNEKLYTNSNMKGYRLPYDKEGNIHLAHKGCKFNGNFYVTGTLRHHKQPEEAQKFSFLSKSTGKYKLLTLKGPWLAIRNLSKGNFCCRDYYASA
jgi:hypothetical protein